MKEQILHKAGDQLPADIIDQLKKCKNAQTNPSYVHDVCKIFSIDPTKLPLINRDYKFFMAGFIAGEGSFNLSAKKTPTAKFGVSIAPEFNITQHVNGISYLLGAIQLFGVGSISYKQGSHATLVFKITGYNNVLDHVVPFWEQFIKPTQGALLRKEREKFIKVVELLNSKHTIDTFVEEILPLWDSLRKQKGQSNQTFPNLASAQAFVRNSYKKTLVKQNKLPQIKFEK